MTVIEECAMCMKQFDATSKNLMVTKLLVTADPLQKLSYCPTRSELKVADALSYVHGISSSEYQSILHTILRSTYRVSVTGSDIPDLAVCLKCGTVLSKLYNTFKSLRQLTKSNSICSRVSCIYAKNKEATNDQSLRNNVTNSSNANNNISDFGINGGGSFGGETEEELPIFDFSSHDSNTNENDLVDPLQLPDPLGDCTSSTASVNDQKTNDIIFDEDAVITKSEDSAILKAEETDTEDSNEDCTMPTLNPEVEDDESSFRGVTTTTATTIPTTTTYKVYPQLTIAKQVVIGGQTKMLPQGSLILQLMPKPGALPQRRLNIINQDVICTMRGDSVGDVATRSFEPSFRNEIAIKNVRTLATEDVPATRKSSRETQGKRPLPFSPSFPVVTKKSSISKPQPDPSLPPRSRGRPSSKKKVPYRPAAFLSNSTGVSKPSSSKTIPCKICKKEFKTSFGLEAHMNMVHIVKL